MDFEAKLARVGLTGKLFKLYAAAIELGDAPVSEVAAQAGLVRTTAYDALARLEEEGLISLVERDGRRHVVARDPTILLEQAEARREMLREVMPHLRSLYNRAQGKPSIRFFEGVDGIKTALWDTLTGQSKLLRATFAMSELKETPGFDEIDRYFRERVQRGIHMRVIRSEWRDIAPIWPDSADELRELRFAPTQFALAMTTFVYDSRVCMISSKREDYGLIIDSHEFAEFQAAMFDAIWSISRRPE